MHCVVKIAFLLSNTVNSKYFQVQRHVQTARESPDLNMGFRSFDNGRKQLYEYVSMQE